MGAAMLTVAEAAEIEECTEDCIYKRIYRNNLHVKKRQADGRRGFEYLIELSDLSEAAQRRYMARKLAQPVPPRPQKPTRPQTLEHLTDEQRHQVFEWQEILDSYITLVSTPVAKNRKTELTEAYVREWNESHKKQVSVRTLLRKEEIYRKDGPAGLADLRLQSKKKGRTAIPEPAWDLFLQYWLDEARPAVSTCYKLTEEVCRNQFPDLLPLPEPAAFYRAIRSKVEYGMIQYFRYGQKAFADKCLPYLRRTYDEIDSNDVWSSDYHTLDLFCRDDTTGRVFRPHLVVWIDIRSRKILSMVLADNSVSDGVILAFKKAAEKYGLPRKVYLDNGREFLVHDFGGRGRRKTDDNADYGKTILERCGVEMYNATVRNAKAKIIERIFRDLKNDFSKLCETYTGGKPEERPERMKTLMKKEENVPLLSEVREKLVAYIDGWHNKQASRAEGMNGCCPDEVYAAHLIRKRVATPDQLNLMLLRSARLQAVTRNGVSLKFGDTVLDYYEPELVAHYQGQKVYVRYDTEHLDSVRVYDAQDRYLCTAKLKLQGGYDLGGDANLEAIKELNNQKRLRRQSVLRQMGDYMERVPAPDRWDVMASAATQAIEEQVQSYQAAILEPVIYDEGSAIVEDEVKVDLEKMVQRARQKA